MKPSDYRSYLSDSVFQHLCNSDLALAEKQYFASAVWAAVFLEAFLAELAGELGLSRPSPDDLNGRIQQMQQYSKNHNPTQPDIPDEIIKRLHDIRNIRNRLVHHTGLGKTTLTQDAEFINGGLKVVLDWYCTICQEKSHPPSEGTEHSNSGIPVFISTITPHLPRQAYFLDVLFHKLRSIGINPIQLVPKIYHQRDPIGFVRAEIEKCRALIVIGLERSHAYFLRDKEGGENEKEEIHRRYTSGWLHLEAGIANALGMEVFALCQKDLCNDGIFDRSWNTYPVFEIQSLEECSAELEPFLDYLADRMKEKQEP